MVYRLLLCGLLFTSAFSLLCAGVLSDQILSLVYQRQQVAFWYGLFDRLLNRSRLLVIAGLAAGAGVLLVWPGLLEYVRTGHVTLHWSRPAVAVFLFQFALFAVLFAVLQKVVELWKDQLSYVAKHHRTV